MERWKPPPRNEENKSEKLFSSFVSPRLAPEQQKNAANVDVPQVCGRDMRSSGGDGSKILGNHRRRTLGFISGILSVGCLLDPNPAARGHEPCGLYCSFFVRSRTMRSRDSTRLHSVTCELVFTSRRGACVLSNPGRDLTGAPSPHPNVAFATRTRSGNTRRIEITSKPQD